MKDEPSPTRIMLEFLQKGEYSIPDEFEGEIYRALALHASILILAAKYHVTGLIEYCFTQYRQTFNDAIDVGTDPLDSLEMVVQADDVHDHGSLMRDLTHLWNGTYASMWCAPGVGVIRLRRFLAENKDFQRQGARLSEPQARSRFTKPGF